MDLNDIKNNPEQIKAMIALLSSLLPESNANAEPTSENKDNTRTNKSKAHGSKKNLFDTMPEKNQHKADIEIDKKLCKFPPTERARAFSYIELRCRSCGKTEKVNPDLVFDKTRYKCNKCSSTSG